MFLNCHIILFNKSEKWKITADTTQTLTPQTHGPSARIHSPKHTFTSPTSWLKTILSKAWRMPKPCSTRSSHLWIGIDYLSIHHTESEYFDQQISKQSFLTETVYQIQHKFDRKKYYQVLVRDPLWNLIIWLGTKLHRKQCCIWKAGIHVYTPELLSECPDPYLSTWRV